MSRIRTIARKLLSNGTANVAWGPSWGNGDGDEYGVGANVSMPTLGLAHNQSIGVTPILWSLSQVFNAQSIGANITGSVLGAPFFQSATTAVTTSNTNTFTLTAPSGIQDGDLLLFLIGTTNVVATITGTPAGAALIRSDLASTNVNAHSYYKIASGESGNYTFTASANTAWTGVCMLLRGVDQSTPINAHGGAAANANDPVAPTITTTVNNAFIVAWASQGETLANTYTPPAGYTERADLNSSNLAVVAGAQSANTKALAVAGATGTATMDSTQALASFYAAQHIAIAPGPVTIAS